MTPDRLITLAIHTFQRAHSLKILLESEGVAVELHNVNLSDPEVAAGVRVRIHESDLPLALRIVENREIFEETELRGMDKKGRLLVPTDFSAVSLNAARLAMQIADKLKWEIEFLYAFLPPANRDTVQLSDAYDYELADIAASREMNREGELLMKRFTDKLRAAIKAGEVPGVKFTTTIAEGLPEEAILTHTRETKPQMIVMGTRGASKKEIELIGSVTAEVLDACRVPAFTVPENVDLHLFANLRHVAFFCNLDQEDILALDTLYRLFPSLNLSVTLIHIPPSWRLRPTSSNPAPAADNLLRYCREHYSGYRFSYLQIDPKAVLTGLHELEEQNRFSMICMPNKHKNVIARVFNPSLAHKILFRADVPMMVIPV